MELPGCFITHFLNRSSVPLTTLPFTSQKLHYQDLVPRSGRISSQTWAIFVVDCIFFFFTLGFCCFAAVKFWHLPTPGSNVCSCTQCPQNSPTLSPGNQFFVLLPAVTGQLLLSKFQQHTRYKTNFLCPCSLNSQVWVAQFLNFHCTCYDYLLLYIPVLSTPWCLMCFCIVHFSEQRDNSVYLYVNICYWSLNIGRNMCVKRIFPL